MVLKRAVALVAAGVVLTGSAGMTGRAGAAPSAQARPAAPPASALGLDGLGLDGLDGLSLEELDLIAGSGTATVRRAAGTGRVATSVAASRGFRDAANAAVLATAEGFADALAATALAARLDAPLLLTRPDQLSGEVATELSRLGVQRTVLLGGTGAIGQPVAADLTERGYDVTRLAGSHRFATARDVALALGASPQGDVLLALGSHPESGQAWPDAVASGALAASGGNPPTLLTAHDQLPDATRQALRELDPQRVLVIGGEAAIPADVVAEVEQLGVQTERLAGASRYRTSRRVAEAALARRPAGDTHPVVLATGESYPDALAAGALASALDGTLALTPSDHLARPVDEFIRANTDRLTRGIVVGGQAAASGTVVAQLEAALNGDPRPSSGGAPAPQDQPEGGEGSDSGGGSSSELEVLPIDDGLSSQPQPAPEEASPAPEPTAGGDATDSAPQDPPSASDAEQDGVLAVFEGQASWYGAAFHGQQTACGEVFDMHQLTAAHRQLPCGTRVRVTNLENRLQVTVRINDHGPHVGDRVLDLSRAAAEAIGMRAAGTAPIRGEVLAD